MNNYEDNNEIVIHGDAFSYMETCPTESVDLIVTDPPYFLSNGGFSNSGGKMVNVDKGKWDQSSPAEAEAFYQRLLSEAYRILKPDGTIWLFGTLHNVYTLGYLLPKNNFKILNNITWQKSNPAPNLSRRMFTHSTETILWAKKANGKQLFNYDDMRTENGNKQMKDVWVTPTINKSEKRFGKHPTQKPLSLLLRILKASSNEESVILDPFMGTGTTLVAAKILGRHAVGVDEVEAYTEIARQRLENWDTEKVGNIK